MTYLRTILFSLCLLAVFSWPLHAQITEYTTENSGIASNYVADIKIAGDGTVWVVHANTDEHTGLVSAFDGDTWTGYSDLPEIYDAALYGNALVVATKTGVYKYSDGAFGRINALGEFDCRSVQINDDTLWAIVYPFQYLNTVTLSKCNLATDTLEQNWLVTYDTRLLGIDDGGALWCKSDGLYRYDGAQWQWFRDVQIERSPFYPSYGFITDLTTDGDGNIWLGIDGDYHAVRFDGTTFSRSTRSMGNTFFSSQGIPWFFLADEIRRYQNNQIEIVYFAAMDHGISCIETNDSSLWIGSNIGITTISLDYMISLDPIYTIQCSFESFATAPDLQSYGDDYWYFPLHIGDTWTYDREIGSGPESFSYADTVMNTVVDTITVNGLIGYKFLDGREFSVDHAGLVYEEGHLRFSFEEPDNTEYQFSSYYSIYSQDTRTYRTISVPAGDFMGYSFFIESVMGGYSYGIVPGIGLTTEGVAAEGRGKTLRLTSAVVGGKTIDQIVPVEEQPLPYNLSITAYPNPFNPATTISFTLPETTPVTLSVYNISGQKVATLVDGIVDDGVHEVVFDGAGLSSGIYVYRIETPGYAGSGKMLLMK